VRVRAPYISQAKSSPKNPKKTLIEARIRGFGTDKRSTKKSPHRCVGWISILILYLKGGGAPAQRANRLKNQSALGWAEIEMKLSRFLSSTVHSGPSAWSRSLLFKGF